MGSVLVLVMPALLAVAEIVVVEFVVVELHKAMYSVSPLCVFCILKC